MGDGARLEPRNGVGVCYRSPRVTTAPVDRAPAVRSVVLARWRFLPSTVEAAVTVAAATTARVRSP